MTGGGHDELERDARLLMSGMTERGEIGGKSLGRVEDDMAWRDPSPSAQDDKVGGQDGNVGRSLPMGCGEDE